jgi:hypothetical protein
MLWMIVTLHKFQKEQNFFLNAPRLVRQPNAIVQYGIGLYEFWAKIIVGVWYYFENVVIKQH